MARTLILAALVGSALTLGVIGLMSMAQSPTDILQHVRVEYGPHPRDMVQIKEGTPYVVPAGKLSVLTAVGNTFNSSCANSGLKVNGQIEVAVFTNLGCGSPTSGSSLVGVPQGFTIASGASVEPTGFGLGRAWGYLANE